MSHPADPDGAAQPLPARVRAWGVSDTRAEHALRQARRGWGRGNWDFGEPERIVGGACPLDVNDRTALATAAEFDWAYVVYRDAR